MTAKISIPKQPTKSETELAQLRRENAHLRQARDAANEDVRRMTAERDSLANALRIGFGNTLYRVEREHAALRWCLDAMLRRRDDLTLNRQMAERSSGVGASGFYRLCIRLTLEIEFLAWFAAYVEKDGTDAALAFIKRRSAARLRYPGDPTTEDELHRDLSFRERVEEALVETIEFHLLHAGHRAKTIFKDEVLKTADGDKFIAEYAGKYYW